MDFEYTTAINAHSKWLHGDACGAFRSALFGDGFLRCLLDLGHRLSRESETGCQNLGNTGGGR